MTERVDALVAAKEGMDQSLFAFGGDDLDDLRARAADPARPDCVQAIEILAPVIPEAAVAAAGAVLALGDSALAVAVLDAIVAADQEALPLALGATAAPEAVVARAAWITLQQVARSASLETLAAAAQVTPPEAQEQAAFAQSVVACRAGVGGRELADPDPSLLLELDRFGDVLPIETSGIADADFGLLTALSSPQRYLLTPDPSAALAMTCGGVDLLLVVEAEVRPQIPDTLLQAPALLALVAVLDPFHMTSSVSLLVFTRPDGAGGVRVTVHDPGGEVIYAGAGTVSDGAVFLSVQTVAGPGAVPVVVSGTLTTEGLELAEALSAVQVAPFSAKANAEPDA